ncbi:hypothetical protein [Clostridium collagenovorans]|nr:hypothetical protein [Clostridium collagenovorans]
MDEINMNGVTPYYNGWICAGVCTAPCFLACAAGAATGPTALAVVSGSLYFANMLDH